MNDSAALAGIAWEPSLLPQMPVASSLKKEVRRDLGAIPSWLAHVAPVPWLARALARTGSSPIAHLSPAVCDLAAFAVSQDNSCRYCFGVQEALFRILGYTEEQIARLER